MTLFRSEALDAKRRRLWGEVRLSQPPTFAIWTVVLAAICVAVLVTLTLGRFTKKETVKGFLIPEAGIVQIRASRGGKIDRIYVQEGERVAKGQPLILIGSDLSSSDEEPLVDQQIAQTDRQTIAIQRRLTAAESAYEAEGSRIRQQIDAQANVLAILMEQRSSQERAVTMAREDESRVRDLAARGFAPQAEIDRRRRLVVAETSVLADLMARQAQIGATISDLRSSLETLPLRTEETKANLEVEASSFAQKRAELELTRSYTLRAPVAGRVSFLQARTGMTPGDDPVLAIAPEGSALEGRLLVPSKAIGFLSVGQEARLQVDAFAFQRFGYVRGRIEGISSSVIQPSEGQYPIEQTEAVYEVRVRLSTHYVDAYGAKRPLRPGMSIVADVPLERKTLWQLLLDPLLAAGRRSFT